MDQVLERIRDSDDFKFNVALVNLDFAIRHGVLDPDSEPEYHAIVDGLAESNIDMTVYGNEACDAPGGGARGRFEERRRAAQVDCGLHGFQGNAPGAFCRGCAHPQTPA